MEFLSKVDLGSFLLSVAVVIGFFGFLVLIIRSIEIPIRIYLDKRKKQADNDVSNEIEDGNGFS